MNKDLLKLYPHDLWENFANLCDAPHPSKHEDAAIKWMKQWAKDHKVKVEQDKTGNLLFFQTIRNHNETNHHPIPLFLCPASRQHGHRAGESRQMDLQDCKNQRLGGRTAMSCHY